MAVRICVGADSGSTRRHCSAYFEISTASTSEISRGSVLGRYYRPSRTLRTREHSRLRGLNACQTMRRDRLVRGLLVAFATA